jgi:hypothetical protein
MPLYAFVGSLAVSTSRPSALRTDLAVGVPLSEGTTLLVLLACDYRFRLLHVGNALPVSVPSEPTRGSELRFIRCAVVASTSSEHDETVTDSATLPSIARQIAAALDTPGDTSPIE